jgi:large subunit ribosomal protein L6
MKITDEAGILKVARPNEEKHTKQLHGTTRALINNMVEGVTKGFEKTLQIVGIGYRAAISGNKLTLNVGYSHPVELLIEKGLEVKVPDPNTIIVSGIDKQRVGEIAANIRAVRKPEPYKGKGIMYKGEHIRRKEGKTAATAAK